MGITVYLTLPGLLSTFVCACVHTHTPSMVLLRSVWLHKHWESESASHCSCVYVCSFYLLWVLFYECWHYVNWYKDIHCYVLIYQPFDMSLFSSYKLSFSCPSAFWPKFNHTLYKVQFSLVFLVCLQYASISMSFYFQPPWIICFRSVSYLCNLMASFEYLWHSKCCSKALCMYYLISSSPLALLV